jgi:hypothetical protein
MKQLRIWAINVSLMLSSLGLGIGLSEVGLRLAKIEGLPKNLQQHSEFSPAFFMMSDPERGMAKFAQCSRMAAQRRRGLH